MSMAPCMRVCGLTTKPTATAHIGILTEQIMKAVGKIICSTEKVWRRGRTVPNTKETTKLERKQVRVTFLGLMAAFLKAILLIMILMVLVSIPGTMAAHSLVTGKTIRCMGRANSSGRMVGCMRALI
mgnify:CR=1 FL=1